MIQIVTIRQQILAALQRVYDSMGFDELLSADRIEKELLASFPPMAVALAPSDGFGEVALKLGYIRLEPGQVVVDAAEVGDALDALCDTCAGECSMCRVKDVLSAIKEARDE